LNPKGSSSKQILKSTAIIGGSNFFVAITRIGQLKIFAVLLGPVGMGLVGLYSSVMNTAAAFGGLGISSSGVRQISEASTSADDRVVATARVALRRLTLVLAGISAIALVLLRKAVSSWVFGNEQYAGAVAVLSLGVLCIIISNSQIAVLNGLRRLSDIARLNVIGAAIGTLVTILLVLIWREQALVYAIASTALTMLLCSWWFVWRLPRPASVPGRAEIKAEYISLVRLGSAFLIASLVMTMALLVTRVVITKELGMASAGYFQAAWGFVVFYIDFILTAMGVDFYPHLTSRIHDEKASNQLVNEQTEVALLLGGPVILGMLLFTPILILLFYSHKFGAATNLLRWLLVGNIVKIVSWPMGYLVMAHARAKTFVIIELVWASTYLGLLYLGIGVFGIDAAGYAFVGAYVAYSAVLYLIVSRYCGFAWTSMNLIFAIVAAASAVIVMFLVHRGGVVGYLGGGLITLGVGIYCLRRLYRMAENEAAVRIINALKKKVMSVFEEETISGS
jgi:antigen flippase